jgi:hypothetical protein
MRAASILLLVGAVTFAIVLPAVGYCDLWLRDGGRLGIEFGPCGKEPNLDHVRWVASVSLRLLAGAIFVLSVVLFLSGLLVRTRRGAS